MNLTQILTIEIQKRYPHILVETIGARTILTKTADHHDYIWIRIYDDDQIEIEDTTIRINIIDINDPEMIPTLWKILDQKYSPPSPTPSTKNS